VLGWLGPSPSRAVLRTDLALEVRDGEGFCFARAVVPGALALDLDGLRGAAERAYRALDALVRERELTPLRMWNYVPAIRTREPGGVSRYEAFNQGRHAVVTDWPRLPAASAVGHHGADLEIHVLAGPEAGVAVENPRQVPAYRYSHRYGPRPPCFARALRVTSRGASGPALVSGTASIVGEDSRHEGELAPQLAETFANLESLASALPIARWRELRVYVVRPDDAAKVARRVRRAFPGLAALEVCHADLCRPELLVEIEGLAHAAP
jgi:chorismate lyase/3-hydroxybenzoate synthase